ncbi:MAG: metal-dependent transcriptional regulator [Eubacteriales bacterium]|uniref:metal-dependent transcriptional regulator n=1 Tax=Fenollaria sp. TaxID=1965292 RepID=UPI002A75B928|nr:metal-dependent transcriptional regulator [Fenollaria sp.]MDD7339640.1 metal-dependent transcriptional regulator [Eubacteriales bacterium]MDY3105681.1 metal-dependent transcriptional regulator [Fenollaria sp.]
MKIGESRENYLEMILMLQNKGIKVRSTDVAKALDFSKPSVSRAVGILKEDGYIEVQDDGELTFTKEGEKLAKSVYDRHCTLRKFFESIGVDPETANDDACRVEHVISQVTFDKIKELVNKDNE